MSAGRRRLDAGRYNFSSVWTVPAPPGRVLPVLADAGEWPRWWPQVRVIEEVADGIARVDIRSVLPYRLELTLRQLREDPAAGVLEAAIGGDLDGWARWTVTGYGYGGGGTRIGYQQQVVVRRPLLLRCPPPAEPLLRVLLRANHAAMMRDGERGLRRHLANPDRPEPPRTVTLPQPQGP